MLALTMLALMLVLKRFAPRLPAPLLTVAAGIALSRFVGLDRLGISLVGTVQAGLPGLALTDPALMRQLWPAALGVALMSFIETAVAGRAFIRKGDLPPEGNHELVATGLANLAGSLFQVMPGGGGIVPPRIAGFFPQRATAVSFRRIAFISKRYTCGTAGMSEAVPQRLQLFPDPQTPFG